MERSDEERIARLMDGTTWFELCDVLKMAGYTIIRDSSPHTALDRAEGYRYLARITRAALEAFVERNDPVHPVLYRPVHETIKMGADNPDNFYQHANISGHHTYRLWGTRGTIHYLGFGTYAGDYGSGGKTGKTGYLEGRDLQVSSDGTFELHLARTRPEGADNWLPMEPETTQLIVRQMFLDHERESAAVLHLECLDVDPRPGPTEPLAVDAGLEQAGAFVVGASTLFANWAEGWAEVPNTLPRFNAHASLAAHGDPNIVYYHGYYQLGPDDALVVNAAPPHCDYWNFQLNNHWMESLDYQHYPIAVNQHQASYRPDGTVCVVVTPGRKRPADLPAWANWLTTVEHDRGTMCWRWVRAEAHPAPEPRVVKRSALAGLT